MVRVPVRLTSSQLIPMRLLASPLLVLLNRAPDIQALQRGYLSRSFHRRNEWSLPHYNAQSCRMHAASGPLELDRENDGGDNRQPSPPSLLENLSPSPDCKVEQMSSTDLAYVGDAVYELSVRSWAVWPPKRTSDLQLQVVELVRGTYTGTACNGLDCARPATMPTPSALYSGIFLSRSSGAPVRPVAAAESRPCLCMHLDRAAGSGAWEELRVWVVAQPSQPVRLPRRDSAGGIDRVPVHH
jgi:hypothetical protein